MPINLEKLINSWWADFSVPTTLEVDDYFEESYGKPELFWKELFDLHQKSKRTPLQSVLGDYYDFYHDCILRHHLSNDVAYTYIENGETKNWSYKQLHRAVNTHIRKWSTHDPKPGQIIAIILPPGIEFLIALLASLRLGLILCFLPPSSTLGRSNILRLLDEISPHLIVAKDDLKRPSLEIDIKGQDEENHTPLSFAYKSADIVQIALSLYRQEPLTFVPLDAHTLYTNPLRDAYFTLNLIENNSWTMPLSCPIRTEPCSTIMTLLAGARRVHVSDEALKRDPRLLKDEKISIIGFSNALQQLWSRTPGSPSRSVKACFRSAFDYTAQSWKDMLKLNGMEKAATFSLVIDNSVGGISFISRPHPETIDYCIKPNLGIPWSLKHPSGKGKTATDFGVFTPKLSCRKNTQKPSNHELTLCSQGYTLIFEKPTRDAVTFPVDALETLINTIPFVEICYLHSGPHRQGHFDLLIFLNSFLENSEEDHSEWTRQIKECIADQLGEDFIPNQIEYFPILPSMERGKIARNWCDRQYREGRLHDKVEDPIYQLLNKLKVFAAGSKFESLQEKGQA